MNAYLANLLRNHGANGAYIELRTDLSDGDTLSTLTKQGKERAMAALIGFASRD